MLVIRHAMACSRAKQRSFPMWAIMTTYFRWDSSKKNCNASFVNVPSGVNFINPLEQSWVQKMLFYFINRIATNSTNEKTRSCALLCSTLYASKFRVNLLVQKLLRSRTLMKLTPHLKNKLTKNVIIFLSLVICTTTDLYFLYQEKSSFYILHAW